MRLHLFHLNKSKILFDHLSHNGMESSLGLVECGHRQILINLVDTSENGPREFSTTFDEPSAISTSHPTGCLPRKFLCG